MNPKRRNAQENDQNRLHTAALLALVPLALFASSLLSAVQASDMAGHSSQDVRLPLLASNSTSDNPQKTSQPGESDAEHKEAHHGKSADEIAKELANPNSSLASLTFKNQFRSYKGDLPRAGSQDNYTLLFQPVFPFPLEPTASGGKANLFIRPAIPLVHDQPVPKQNGTTFYWDDNSGMGDIGFDVAYGVTEKDGFIWAVGAVGTLPTATNDDLAGKQWRLGPEFFIGKASKKGLIGIFPNHQWDIGGWGKGDDYSYSTTQIQPFLKYLPGGGWAVGSLPIMSYDWENEDWTVPLNFTVSKTLQWGNTPIKLELDLNYYVEQPDEFGPDWMIGINLTPVVPNFINSWIRGK